MDIVRRRHPPVLVQCLLYDSQGGARLLLHTPCAIGDMLLVQEGVYAVMYAGALLWKR
jgi:hypothetical protein